MDTSRTEASPVPTPQPSRSGVQSRSAVFWSPIPTREELQLPSSDDIRLRGDVEVLHPGYNQILFSLPAFDSLAGQFGVNRSIVEDACRIITNNQDGFLTTDHQGSAPVPNVDSLLRPGKYYYHLVRSAGPTKYPVVAHFASWVFPKTPPTHWSRVRTAEESAACLEWARSAGAMSDAVKDFDKCCIVTKYSSLTENARLIPRSQSDWFTANDMEQFNIDASAKIDDVANGVTLRSDVHTCFDRCKFVFYPTDQGSYVAYIIGHHQLDYAKLLHRRLVAMHPRVAIQFLYARFAYNIIHLLREKWTLPGRYLPIPNEVLEVMKAKEEQATKTKKRRRILPSVPEDGEEASSMNADSASLPPADAERSGTSVAHSPLHNDSSSSMESMLLPPEDPASSMESTLLHLSEDPAVAARDKRWRERLIERFPIYPKLPQVRYPPDVGIGCHEDTPYMQRLSEAYIAKNPQVRQVTGRTASEHDLERWDALSDDDMSEEEDVLHV